MSKPSTSFIGPKGEPHPPVSGGEPTTVEAPQPQPMQPGYRDTGAFALAKGGVRISEVTPDGMKQSRIVGAQGSQHDLPQTEAERAAAFRANNPKPEYPTDGSIPEYTYQAGAPVPPLEAAPPAPEPVIAPPGNEWHITPPAPPAQG